MKKKALIKNITFHIGLPKTGTTSLQNLASIISTHVNLGANFLEVNQKNKYSFIKRNGDYFIKLFYDKGQIFLRHLKNEKNIKKKIIDSLNQFKNSRYENAFVSSEFLCTMPINTWLQLESLLQNQEISIKKIIITVRNPKERFISSLSRRIVMGKYRGKNLEDSYYRFIQNELNLYQNIKDLKNLYKDKVAIIDYDSYQERIIDEIFEQADLKKGFPFNKKVDQILNSNNFNSNRLPLIFAIINNRSIHICYKFIAKLGILKAFKSDKFFLKNIIEELPDHNIESKTFKPNKAKYKQIEKLFKEYLKYSTIINYKKNMTQFPMAKLQFRYFIKYILLLHTFHKNINL